MNPTIQAVVARAAKTVSPGPAARKEVSRVAERVTARVEDACRAHPEVVGISLGGSLAKDTWLAGDVDIDVFVKITTSVDDTRFEEVGLEVGREALRGHRPGKKYAQHPYTEATVEGFKVNVVPCYNVKAGEWRSAADRSIHHVTFVRDHLDDAGRLQVRLLKKFMKAVGVYGAEIQKEGFSGYATEVLIHQYGTFESALRSFSDFVPDSEVQYFTLFDPIDEARDLGKAISRETVARMVMASRAFLEWPSASYFRRVTGRARPRLEGDVYALAFEHDELSEDTLWGELKRSARQVAKHVREEGFTLARVEAASDNLRSSAIVMLPLGDTLPVLAERAGPGVELSEGARRFVAKNKKSAELIWVGEDGRLRLLEKRRFTSLGALLKEVVASRAQRIGISKEVARGLKGRGRVLHGEGLRREAARRPWLKQGVARVLSDAVGT